MKKGIKLWLAALTLGLAMSTAPAAFAEEDEFADEFASEEGSGSEMDAAKGLEWTGFLQMERGGHIGKESSMERQWVLDQTRFRLKTNQSSDLGNLYLKLDFLQDGVTDQSKIDLREARLSVAPVGWMDLSLGKQVNTWGVGDMLFINDLFPKNWMAMFLGQDMEFMKDPANSYRMSAYLGSMTFDLVVHPEFAPDTTPNGCVFAIYNPNSMLDSSQPSLAGSANNCEEPAASDVRTGAFDKGETAGRLKAQLGSYELALYGYRGFYKNPRGMAFTATGLSPIYPRLATQGLSVEGQLGPGIVSFEAGRYQSLDDEDGTNALIENSMVKGLVGYRMDISANISAGLQTYQERMEDYDNYEKSIIGMYQQMGLTQAQAEQQSGYLNRKEEVHNTYTLRLTFKAQQDTLWINFFGYQRPEDKDSFYKMDVSKRVGNHFNFTVGANLFDGDEELVDRDFGMLKDEDNAFARIQYNY